MDPAPFTAGAKAATLPKPMPLGTNSPPGSRSTADHLHRTIPRQYLAANYANHPTRPLSVRTSNPPNLPPPEGTPDVQRELKERIALARARAAGRSESVIIGGQKRASGDLRNDIHKRKRTEVKAAPPVDPDGPPRWHAFGSSGEEEEEEEMVVGEELSEILVRRHSVEVDKKPAPKKPYKLSVEIQATPTASSSSRKRLGVTPVSSKALPSTGTSSSSRHGVSPHNWVASSEGGAALPKTMLEQVDKRFNAKSPVTLPTTATNEWVAGGVQKQPSAQSPRSAATSRPSTPVLLPRQRALKWQREASTPVRYLNDLLHLGDASQSTDASPEPPAAATTERDLSLHFPIKLAAQPPSVLPPQIQPHPDEPNLPPTLSFGKFRQPFLEAASGSINPAALEAYFNISARNPQSLHIIPDRDGEVPVPEFVYSDDLFYTEGVEPPKPNTGCVCIGPCGGGGDCMCLQRQEAYFKHHQIPNDTLLKGFACDSNGLVRDYQFPIFECSDTCGCPPSCRNRTVQNASPPAIDIYKTKNRGWGAKARKALPNGTFIGFYTGEIVLEADVDTRARIYDEKVGRTYLFDLDGYHISRPPPGLEEIDPEWARHAYEVRDSNDVDDAGSTYTVDAFHWGNWTRFANHSCNSNVGLASVYIEDYDIRKPRLAFITRRDIAKDEELTISYFGPPGEEIYEVEEVEADNPKDKDFISHAISRKASGKNPISGKGGKGGNTKKTATTHTKSGTGRKMVCRCGAANCKGRLFGLGDAPTPPSQ